MDKDRTEICNIISEMLDNPDEHEIYPTTRAYNKLENHMEFIRYETLGWMYAYACQAIDKGVDIRQVEVPQIMEQFKKDMAEQ
jgi:hypothetical protein